MLFSNCNFNEELWSDIIWHEIHDPLPPTPKKTPHTYCLGKMDLSLGSSHKRNQVIYNIEPHIIR